MTTSIINSLHYDIQIIIDYQNIRASSDLLKLT